VPGWLARRDPEPRAWAGGLLVPDLLIRPSGGDSRSGVLVCLVRTAAQASRLATLLPSARGGEPLLFAGPGSILEPLREQGVESVSGVKKCFLESDGRMSVIREDDGQPTRQSNKRRS
jgi:hypothetical protein